jgi:hypothetical protein
MAPLIATWNEAYDIDGFGQSCRSSIRAAPSSTLGTASTDDSYRALISGHARLGSVSDRDKFGAAYRLAELEENKLQEPERPRSSQDPRSGREVRNRVNAGRPGCRSSPARFEVRRDLCRRGRVQVQGKLFEKAKESYIVFIHEKIERCSTRWGKLEE